MFEWFLESQGDSEIRCQYILNEFREYTIGRHRGYDISSQNAFVSRNHGVLIVKPDNSIYIKDLNVSIIFLFYNIQNLIAVTLSKIFKIEIIHGHRIKIWRMENLMQFFFLKLLYRYLFSLE